jgi:hypothetical protein
MREGERGGEEGGAPGREERRHVACCRVSSSLLGPPLYSGEGLHLARTTSHQGRQSEEGQGQRSAKEGGAKLGSTNSNPSPSRLGP